MHMTSVRSTTVAVKGQRMHHTTRTWSWLSILLVSYAVSTAGCKDARVDSLQEQLAKQEDKIELLEVAQDELETQLLDATRSITKLQVENIFVEMDKIAYLTPGSGGYSTIRFDLGILTADIEDIRPYGNGSKVTISFGNPLACTINGLKMSIDYGEVNEDGTPDNDSARQKDVTVSESMKSASFTDVELVLEGVPANSLGFVRLKDVSHVGIRLSIAE